MKCESCGKENSGLVSYNGGALICGECNDNDIVYKYHYKEEEILDKFDDKGLLSRLRNEASSPNRITTLPTDSQERKGFPLFRGCFRYFSAALAGVARISQKGNDKHNPGEEMHHARNKSSDHGDCILRHLMDTEDLLAAYNRGESINKEQILEEVSQMAWRTLALSQELHEKLGGAPLAPGAKKNA